MYNGIGDSMATIKSYIRWRGDTSMNISPFNEVDNLILSVISYVNFDDIVLGVNSHKNITMKEAADVFFNKYDVKQLMSNFSLVNDSINIFKLAANTKRFGNIKLSKYINHFNYEEQKQFSAIKFTLEDKSVYVAFRGTDDTLLGWKEDFNMCFMYPVPSQIEAQKYLNKIISIFDRKIYLGGHSKGGNLAVYAGCKCRNDIKRKIINIYNNDGPGFTKEFIESDDFKDSKNKIIKIVPETSIVGMLLESSEEYIVVKSSGVGVMQHDASTWQISGSHFMYANQTNKESKFFDSTISSWLNKIDQKKREKFVDALFSIFENSNIKTVNDLSKIKIKKIIEIISVIKGLNKEDKDIFLHIIKSLIKEASKNYKFGKSANKV